MSALDVDGPYLTLVSSFELRIGDRLTGTNSQDPPASLLPALLTVVTLPTYFEDSAQVRLGLEDVTGVRYFVQLPADHRVYVAKPRPEPVPMDEPFGNPTTLLSEAELGLGAAFEPPTSPGPF